MVLPGDPDVHKSCSVWCGPPRGRQSVALLWTGVRAMLARPSGRVLAGEELSFLPQSPLSLWVWVTRGPPTSTREH